MVVITLLLTCIAGAHVAPSVDDNNRYLKLTPFGDRVRLAYTVFFGEVPGATERRTIDTNRDGQISDAEGHEFGLRIAAEVASGLELEVDGTALPVRWEVIDVGMGTPSVAAGSFSVDMVTYACLATARGRHRLMVRDRFRIPRPGETEVKVEDSPGVQIEHARVGTADDPSFDYRFAGPDGPLSDQGLDLQFTAGPRSEVAGTCAAPRPEAPSHMLWFVLLGAGGIVVAAAVAAIVFMRRKYFRP